MPVVPPSEQWVATTASRIATCSYSWMQAVHWVVGSGSYQPRRQHGPRFGETTVRIAQFLADLTPCRPGIAHLVRLTGLSRRTVQYHLEMLREAGLLAYLVKGTRMSGLPNLASEFARVIPPAFDLALGIRTTGAGTERRPVGIAERGRALIMKLAKKAARKVRKARRKPKARCTPMEVSTSASSSADVTTTPSESKLDNGKKAPLVRKQQEPQARKLNQVGRRYQLAGELIRRVPWLSRASTPRIAWVLKQVADAGWTADQVIAWLNLAPEPATIRRPSGLLAARLRGAATTWTTEATRAAQVEIDRDMRRAERSRHTEWEGDWLAPHSPRVMAEVQQTLADLRQRTSDAQEAPQAETPCTSLESLPRELVIDMRRDAQKDHGLVRNAIAMLGETDARRLYTHQLVDLVLRLTTGTATLHTTGATASLPRARTAATPHLEPAPGCLQASVPELR
ncbi:helix-turn-helix domain-containing protein [Streptomyces albireticuli]|uniref:helix-turn-helix domain-containing protein n=1 Tax=Streptomyces albireticuli TaxID=1940 RepID=UPI001E4F12F8|nr:helix-turn-helix domain-containing protein [Streptomyces albireticuli]MCD9146129.1 helix-turn-helix domain-containing protein [Streptomyces albireticuli]MCD9165758.1 helix-turn-helix domain-containing protein [Streptomyces albireticuli]MCD9195976.1 helix-turn-helix domain-containing protein [Streptomyces albireticuli]